jgi:hypothetical protein
VKEAKEGDSEGRRKGKEESYEEMEGGREEGWRNRGTRKVG